MKKWKYHDEIKKGIRGVEFYTKKDKEDFYIFILETGGNLYDWLANFMAVRVALFEENKKLRCHKGFLSLAYIVIDTIKKTIESKKHKIKSFYLYGLSQGGGVATITALLLQNKYPDCSFFIRTYGAPACLNLKLKKHTENIQNMKITRVYYSLDIVVHFICYWFFGYFYTGDKNILKQKWYNFFTPIKNHRKIVQLGYIEQDISI